MSSKIWLGMVALALLAVVFAGSTIYFYIKNVELNYNITHLNYEILNYKNTIDTLNRRYEMLNEVYIKTITELNNTKNELIKTKNELSSVYNEYNTLKNNYNILQNRYNTLENDYKILQDKYVQVEGKLNELSTKYINLENQLNMIKNNYTILKNYVYKPIDFVKKYYKYIENIYVNIPQIDNSYEFVNIYNISTSLDSRYFLYYRLALTPQDSILVSVNKDLQIYILDITNYNRFKDGYTFSYIASGQGRLEFHPRSRDEYYLVIFNDKSYTISFNMTLIIKYMWYYCDIIDKILAKCPYSRYVVGINSTQLFKLLALYNYWYNNRIYLANYVQSRISEKLSLPELYALSLAMVLKSGGYSVVFAAATSSLTSREPNIVLPVVRIPTMIDIRDYLINFTKTIDIGSYNIIWNYYNNYLNIVIDTYYVYDIVDRKSSTEPALDILYIDNITELP